MKLFPIQNSKMWRAIPWEVIEPHEAQALINHDQTLTRLAERCGLSPSEAVAVIEDKRFWNRWPLARRDFTEEADECLLQLALQYYRNRT